MVLGDSIQLIGLLVIAWSTSMRDRALNTPILDLKKVYEFS